MTLAEKWTTFVTKLPQEAGKEQILFAQACYLAGAQAAFQILGAASTKTQEEALTIWHDFQQEILNAVGRPQEPLVQVPKPSLIV